MFKANELKVGDRIWIVDVAGNGAPGYYLHADTRRVYKKIMARRRAVRISEIDERGIPWFACQFRHRNGSLEYHWLAVVDGDNNWRPVVPRRPDKDAGLRQPRRGE